MLKQFREKYIGDRHFYKSVLIMVIPMILQNLVTNFVSLIDNIMVGQIGTEQMNGVSIVNQYIFVFNITALVSHQHCIRSCCRSKHIRSAILWQRRP